MEETFIVDLPPEANNIWFNVYAPAGGLGNALFELLEAANDEGTDQRRHLDLDVRQMPTHGTLRIYPGKNISQDGRNPLRFYVSDGVAVFLDEFGEEHSDNLSFGGSIWAEVVRADSITGELNLWRQSLPELNAAS